jgi:excisionase family DNA binding protein
VARIPSEFYVSATDEIRNAEAARILGVSTRTLRRYAEAGVLRCRTLPSGQRRFDRRDVEALREQTMAGVR